MNTFRNASDVQEHDTVVVETNTRQGTTDNQAVIHLIKSSLGTGILAMPYAFSKAGLFGGLIGTFLVTIIYTYCVHIMVKAAHELCKRHNIQSLDFKNLIDTAFTRGPDKVQKFARPVRITVEFFLIAMTISACAVYTVFIASTLSEVFSQWLNRNINLRIAVLVITPILIIITMFRGMRHITPFSFISNILILISLGIILSFFFIEPLPPVTDRPFIAPITSIPLFLSTATFAISGITVVMPLENSMENPKKFGIVLVTSMTLIASFYSALGFFGYLKYGDEVEGSISLNLPEDTIPAQSANLMLGIAVGFTYPLVMQCCVEFTWPHITRKFPNLLPRAGLYERLFRLSLVLTLSLLAALIPNLGVLISLSGALFTSTTAFLLPPLLDWVVFSTSNMTKTMTILRYIKNILIILFGLTIAVTGTITSIQDLINTFHF